MTIVILFFNIPQEKAIKNRYIGDYPVIGIRPCIDGRRGPLKVRESLEDQTMGMAKAVKKLYEENLRYSNGEPVKVIIADTTIGRAAVAAATMRDKSYLQIGSQCMGIGGSIINQEFFEEYLGMRVESVDEVEILRRMEEHIYNEDEYQKALAWIKKYAKQGFDKNPDFVKKSDEQKEKDWEFTAKMAVIIEDLYQGNPNLPEGCGEEAVGHNAICGGFQGQRQWTDHWPNCDFPEAILNTSFDWNGAREPFTLATENDTLNGVGMMFMNLLTNRAQMFADVRTYWSGDAVKRVTGYEIEGHANDANGVMVPPCTLMAVEPGDDAKTPIWDTYKEIVAKYDERGDKCFEEINKWDFYDKTRAKSKVVIMTSETAIYANIILRKGVVIN